MRIFLLIFLLTLPFFSSSQCIKIKDIQEVDGIYYNKHSKEKVNSCVEKLSGGLNFKEETNLDVYKSIEIIINDGKVQSISQWHNADQIAFKAVYKQDSITEIQYFNNEGLQIDLNQMKKLQQEDKIYTNTNNYKKEYSKGYSAAAQFVKMTIDILINSSINYQ